MAGTYPSNIVWDALLTVFTVANIATKTYMTHGLPLSPFGSEQSQSRKCDLFIFPPIHVSTEAPASDLLLSTLWGFYGYSFFFLSRKNKASSHFPSAVFACTAVSGINVSALEMPP